MDAAEAVQEAGRLATEGLESLAEGRLDVARSQCEAALTIVEDLLVFRPESQPLLRLAAHLNHQLGLVDWFEGDLSGARRRYRKALAIHEYIGLESTETALFLSARGLVLHSQGDHEGALRDYGRALQIYEGTDASSSETAMTALAVGSVLQMQGNLDDALEKFEQALTIYQSSGPESRKAAAHNRIGSVLQERGELQGALQQYEMALAFYEGPGGHPLVRSAMLLSLGLADRDTGRSADYLKRALADLSGFPSSALRAIALTAEAMLRRANDLDGAIDQLREAVKIVESLRSGAGKELAREHVFGAHEPTFEALIACLFERGEADHEEAFHHAERSRARTLAELLGENRIEVPPGEGAAAGLEKERELLSKRRFVVHHEAEATRQGNFQEVANLHVRLKDVDHELKELRGELGSEYADLRHPGRPLTLGDVQQVLEADTLLLEYSAVGRETFVWAIRSDRFEMVSLGSSRRDLEELLDAALGPYRLASEGDDRAAAAQAKLGDILLGRIPSEWFADAKRILIVPDGPLSYLPFEILPLGGKLLADHPYLVSYVPSATVLSLLRDMVAKRQPSLPRGELIGFGDPAFRGRSATGDADEDEVRGTAVRILGGLPPLPGTRAEVERIAHLFPAPHTYYGPQATERTVKMEVEGHRLVHLATHGLLDDRNPLYSGLALAPPTDAELAITADLDDLLQVYEMFALPLHAADVVVCSACQTGLGTIKAGEGLVGMSRALFFAGAKCVVLSLWPVPDIPTARLMERFYQALAGDKSDGREPGTPAEALKRAKASVRETHPRVYRDPYSWAAFVPVGLGW